jgi:HSP20 family protein
MPGTFGPGRGPCTSVGSLPRGASYDAALLESEEEVDDAVNKDIEMKHEEWPARLWDWFDVPEFGRWFEGLRPLFRDEARLRIEQELTGDTMVIRAEMPGIDPDKDVEITLDEGVLRIRAERRFEAKEEKKGLTRSEFRYGAFERALRVPEGVDVDDVTAAFKDGILEVRVPYKTPTEAAPRKVAIARS